MESYTNFSLHTSTIVILVSMFQTCTNDAISSKALKAGTEEITNGVRTGSVLITIVSVPGTLIDICQ